MAKHRALMFTVTGLIFSLWVVVAAATEPMKIKLDYAVNQALLKNAQLIPAMLDVELARIDLQKAEADATLSPNPTQLRQRRLALVDAENNYAALKTKTARDTRSLAFDILKAEDTVTLNQRKHQQAVDDRNTTKLKVDLNLESPVALLTAEKSVVSAQQALDSSIAALEVARMNLLQYIGAEDITLPITLEIPDFELTLDKWEVAEAEKQALAHTAKIVAARNNLEEAELEMKLNDSGFTPTTDRRKYQIAVEKARLTLSEEEKTARIQVRQYIADINALHQELAAAEIAVQVAEEQLAANQIKHQQGMITDAQLAAQENTLLQAKQSLLDTKFRIRDKQQDFRDYLDV